MSAETPDASKPEAAPAGLSPAAGHVVRGTLYLAVARVATLSVSLISMAILARLLTPADFGMMTAALIIMNLPAVIYEGAFSLLLVQRKEIDSEFIKLSFWMALGVALAAMLALIAAAPLVESFFGFAGLGLVIMAVSVTLPLKAASSISLGLLRREHRFAAVATMFFFAGGVGNILVAAPLAYMGFGVWALAIGAIVSHALEAIAGYAVARFPLSPPKHWKRGEGVGRASALFTATQLLNFMALCTPNFIIGKFMGAGALGLYSRSTRILDIAIDGAANPIQQTLIPAFSRMQDDLTRSRHAFERALSLALLLFGALAAFVIVEAEAAIRILMGPDWLSIVLPVQVLFAAFAPRAAYRLCESLAFGQGRAGRTAAMQALYLGLMVVGSFAGLAHGVTGVAIGIAAGLWIFYLAALAMAARLVNSGPSALAIMHGRALAAALIVGLSGWLVIEAASGAGFWISHILGGFGCIAGGALVFFAPAKIMGEDFVWARTQIIALARKLYARIAPPARTLCARTVTFARKLYARLRPASGE
ncbi:MAG: oligosaccharide flippase family protein [Hyphomonadaceae bacterium]